MCAGFACFSFAFTFKILDVFFRVVDLYERLMIESV